MILFPDKYSIPELVDIVSASKLGWHASCPDGSGPTTGPPTCNNGNGAGPPGKIDQGLFIIEAGAIARPDTTWSLDPEDVGRGL